METIGAGAGIVAGAVGIVEAGGCGAIGGIAIGAGVGVGVTARVGGGAVGGLADAAGLFWVSGVSWRRMPTGFEELKAKPRTALRATTAAAREITRVIQLGE